MRKTNDVDIAEEQVVAEESPVDEAESSPEPSTPELEAAEDPPSVEEDHGLPTSSIVEAILLATDSPIGAAKIARIIGGVAAADVRQCVADLNAKYEETGASFRVDEIAKGYQILTLPEYNVWLRKLLKIRSESKLSQAALESLAVVAYRQPVIRATIEEIRGVAVGEVINRLREMNLVKIVGRAEDIGRPLLYGTTKRFLEVFGLASLDELPNAEELTPPEKQAETVEATEPEDDASPETVEAEAEAPAGETPAEEDADAAFERLAQAAQDSKNGSADEEEADA